MVNLKPAIAIIFLVALAGIFFFFFSEQTDTVLEEGYSKILRVIEKNGLTKEQFFEAKIIFIEEGELVNDFSPGHFAGLERDLKELKSEFQKLQAPKEKNAFLSAIEVYLEMIELEKQEKQIYLDVIQLKNSVSDLESACKNLEQIKSIAVQDFELTISFSELDQKNIDVLLNNSVVENIDNLLLENNPLEQVNLYPYLFDDIHSTELLCPDTEGEST